MVHRAMRRAVVEFVGGDVVVEGGVGPGLTDGHGDLCDGFISFEGRLRKNEGGFAGPSCFEAPIPEGSQTLLGIVSP